MASCIAIASPVSTKLSKNVILECNRANAVSMVCRTVYAADLSVAPMAPVLWAWGITYGFRGKTVTVPRLLRSAFRISFGHDSGMMSARDSNLYPVTLGRLATSATAWRNVR